ncbi:MAG: PAS domain S-box protein [Gemmatimonadales bacterium]
MMFRPPLRAREGGPTPGTGSTSVSSARSPEVSEKHLVQFYDDDAQLADVVGTFLAAALVRGDGVVVVSTADHRERFEGLLQSAGIDMPRSVQRGQYVVLDAASTLDAIMDGDRPARERFDRIVGARVTALAERFGTVRAFGEMVGLLCEGGRAEAALELEAIWNELLARTSAELLCAYPASSVRGDAGTMKRICSAHGEVVAGPRPDISAEERLKAFVELQGKAEGLEREVGRRESTEAELSDFLENSLEGIYALAPDGSILWANHAALELLGHRRKDFVGHPIADFFVDRDVIEDALSRLATGEGVVSLRARIRGRGGRVKHVLTHARGIYVEGTLVRTRCFMLDETPVAIVERDTALLAAIVDSSDDAIVSKDLDGLITSWNRGAQRIFGYEEHEVLGKSITILIPADRLDEEPKILERIRAGQRVEHFETVRRRKDGTLLEISLTISPVRDWSGQIIGASKIARDISERKRTERLLQRAEERYGRLASLLPVGVFACDESGVITYFNDHAEKLWGRAPRVGVDELSGTLGMYRVDSDTPLAFEDGPVAIALREQRSVRNVQLVVERPTKERVTVLMNVDYQPAANGEGASAIGIFQDVTPMAETQRALAQQKQSLETLLELLPVGVFIAHDPECRTISGNREAERMLRTGAGNNLSVSATEGIAPTHFTVQKNGVPVADAMLPVQRAAKGEIVLGEELDVVFDDGTVVHEICWARPLYDELGEPSGAIACILDASELKKKELELQEADRRKDEFLATLAHELRNPLAPIIAGLDVMEMSTDAETLARTRRIMERQAHQLAALVDDLLDVSRITTGKFQLRKKDVDLAEVLQVAVDSARPAAAENGHELVVDLPPRPAKVHADPNRLAQVFSNLLDNAIKYTPAGGRVEVTAATGDGLVRVSVKDSGIGIPADKLDLVFEKFIQIDRPQERGHAGLGIGLTLVKAVVELHGGSVSVESAGPDAGATFTVTLPLVTSLLAADAAAAELRPEERAKKTRRVLVADDNEAMLESLGMVISLMGHEVRTASDGESAVAIAEEFRPDVVLMDLGMPRMNGYEAARRMRARPWGANVKLIALTGWGQDEHRRRTETVGFDRHVVKPVRQEELERLFAET